MIADEFTQLVFHVLAHVPLAGPGDVHDPRYIGWATARSSDEDRALLDHDAGLLARVWAGDPRCAALHELCELHQSWPRFAATAGRALAELDEREVDDPALLDRLRGVEGAELFHAALALLGPGFRRTFAELRPALATADAELRRWIDRLAPRCPGLADARVELVWALGVHGRGFARRILVGAPAAWNGCSAARQAVLAAHEHAVLAGDAGDYATQEWVALVELARCLRGAEPELREAHRNWLASLELSPLLAELVDHGRLDAGEVEALLCSPSERADRLSAGPAGAWA